MNPFVLDTSLAMSWCFADEGGSYSEKVLNYFCEASAVVPPLWTYEVANVLLVAERKKRLNSNEANRYLNLLFHLPIEVDDSKPNAFEILRLGRELKLSSYDAAYLELAIRYGCPLATLDQPLKRAAKKIGIPLI